MRKMYLAAVAGLAFTVVAHANTDKEFETPAQVGIIVTPAPMQFLPTAFCANLRRGNPDAQQAADLYCPPAADPAITPVAPVVGPGSAGHLQAAAS